MAHGHDGSLSLSFAEHQAEEPCLEIVGFEAFSREQYSGLLQFLRLRTPNDEDAKDAAQESLMRLMRYRETEPASAWKPLLYRIAINVVNEQYRRGGARHSGKHVSLEDMELPSEEPTQEELIERGQQEAWLRAAILALPARCRQVYLLSRMQGMTYQQIARHCDISVKTVEKHMTQALGILCRKVGLGAVDAS